jgi:trehalose/maltose hydrolase-like predicted phosphorylase
MAVIKHTGLELDLIEELNNKYVIANGYLGFSSIMEELKQEDKAHVKVNGIYSDFGKQKRFVSVFNPFYIYVYANNQLLHPKNIFPKHHEQSLDLETGLFTRETVYTVDNIDITIYSEKFLNQKNLSLGYLKYIISANHNIDIELYQGIDKDFIKQNQEEFKDIQVNFESGMFSLSAKHKTSLQPLYIISAVQKNFSHLSRKISSDYLEHYSIELTAGEHYEIVKYAAISTDKRKNISYLQKNIDKALSLGYELSYENNNNTWKKLWRYSGITIVNNDLIDKYNSYNLYQLISHRPYSSSATVSRYGLTNEILSSGSEIELFVFSYYLNTDFSLAKRILMNRVKKLGEAIKKAKKLKKNGALFSNENNDYYTNALIVYNLNRYVEQTLDNKILLSGTLELVLEICRFYLSILEKDEKSTSYSILSVSCLFGELKEIDNSTLLNYLVKNTFSTALSLVSKAKTINRNEVEQFLVDKKYQKLISEIKKVKNKIYLKRVNSKNIIEMYDNFFEEESEIKIADILVLFILFPETFSLVEKRANYQYYKDLAKFNHFGNYFLSLTELKLGLKKEAYRTFKNLLSQSVIDEDNKGSNNHFLDLGLSGSIYYYFVYGIAALEHKGYLLTADSLLPSDIRRIEFNVKVGKNIASIKLKRSSAEVRWNE